MSLPQGGAECHIQSFQKPFGSSKAKQDRWTHSWKQCKIACVRMRCCLEVPALCNTCFGSNICMPYRAQQSPPASHSALIPPLPRAPGGERTGQTISVCSPASLLWNVPPAGTRRPHPMGDWKRSHLLPPPELRDPHVHCQSQETPMLPCCNKVLIL